jgi:uncharacterized protein
MKKHAVPVIFFALLGLPARAQTPAAQFDPVSFSRVSITDSFWKPKLDKVATTTLQACIYQTEVKTPRIRNFEKVARKQNEQHEGIYYDDSDVYKALEAIAYSLKNRPDAALEQKADEWIDKIAAAQLPDGYLNTYYTLMGLDKRWTDMEKHEDYNAGHLIEAAVAYYNTTGKRKLLDVAIRFADHIDSTFRLQHRPWVSGHQEIELALMKLYHATKNDRYLKLADWYLQQRGHGHGKGVIWDQWKDPRYCQDEVPVKEQKEITGHAVRAMYLYTGAADVAAATRDAGYMKAMQTVWEDVVYRNMYITGGIGSSGRNEGFSTDYDLPNEQAYCETCASVGMVFWNQRMNLLTGDAKYADVLERSLYNGALSGLSLSGDRFFYGNPLASSGQHSRSEWFGTACCPSNISRLVASLGDYIYGQSPQGIWVNLFVGSNTNIRVGNTQVPVKMETNYPWEGQVKLTLSPARPLKTTLHVRVPGWVKGTPAPGDLYAFLTNADTGYKVVVNGKTVPYREENRLFCRGPDLEKRRRGAGEPAPGSKKDHGPARAQIQQRPGGPAAGTIGVLCGRGRQQGPGLEYHLAGSNRFRNQTPYRGRRAGGSHSAPGARDQPHRRRQRGANPAAAGARHPLLYLGQPGQKPHAGLAAPQNQRGEGELLDTGY